MAAASESFISNIIPDDEEPTLPEPAYVNDDILATKIAAPNQLIPSDDTILQSPDRLLKQYILHEGFGDHHITIYDNWIKNTAPYSVYGRQLNLKDPNPDPTQRRIICFENLKIHQPRFTRDGKVYFLTPKMAREQGVTYGSDWHIDVVVRRGDCNGQELERRGGICIGTVPTMLKSHLCILYRKTPKQLAQLGEDPKDPGGYFIVEGVEKTVLLQEQLAVNKIFLMLMNTKGTPVARLTAATHRGTALIELVLDEENHSIIEIRLPSLHCTKQGEKCRSINVMRLYRLASRLIMHTEVSTNDIIAHIVRFIKQDPEIIDKSLLKLTRTKVDYSLGDDFSVILEKMDKVNLPPEQQTEAVINVLTNDLFPHLNTLQGPDGETENERRIRIVKAKLNLLCIMTARLLEHLAGFRALDDRDSWSNKRVEGAGRMMEQLLRNAWRKVVATTQASIDTLNTANIDLNSIVSKLRYTIITSTFRDSFITTNWGVKGTQVKSNIAQTLVRDSVVATYAHLKTIDVSISRTDRQQGLRLVQMSQWGFVDPIFTPEGENAGILKNMAITATLSLERSDVEIIRQLIGDPERNISIKVIDDIERAKAIGWIVKLIVNGKFLGWCNGIATYEFLRTGRRQGNFFPDMSVVMEGDELYVDISPSRLIRPLLIVDPETQELIYDTLPPNERTISRLVKSSALEYISAWEQEYIKLATSRDVIIKRLASIAEARASLLELERKKANIQAGHIIYNPSGEIVTLEDINTLITTARDVKEKIEASKPYTHCEIDPTTILGVASALIPWPNHNQAPRNTYQVAMGKQALGTFHPNHLNRYDGKTKILTFPNRPMVETEMYDIIGLRDKGPGENVVVAFMAYPYTEEDAFIFKKEFLDNGGFRIYKYLMYTTTFKLGANDVKEVLQHPGKYAQQPERYKYLQANGLPMIGAFLTAGDAVIGKMQHIQNTEQKNESIKLRIGEEGIVDKILVTTDNRTTTVTVKLRIMRVPQEGDKFAPRNAQKGTIGAIMSDINMPRTKSGIVPDIIVNPHCIPSRMTLSYPMELIASKHGAMRGVYINGGAFEPFKLNEYRDTLKYYDMEQFGYETMYSGLSGKELKAEIFCGPVFFQALRHHVKDKIQVREVGPVKPQTRQPPKGRGNSGGLRFGEMERDAAISYGASALTRERLMLASDGYPVAFCKKCGIFAVNDVGDGYRPCKICMLNATQEQPYEPEFGRCTIPYAYKLLIHYLGTMGINLRPEFMTSDEYLREILRGKNIDYDKCFDDIAQQLEEADEANEDDQADDEINFEGFEDNMEAVF